jgi:DNA replication and repair protein RecF
MKLVELQITSLRNIDSLKLPLHSNFNIISGPNGSGKTSFLEAIYLLSSAYSFRTRENASLITHEKESLTVFAKTEDEQSISIQKSLHAPTLVRLNNQPCLVRSELAFFLPCQIFYQDIFQIIDAGPSLRRGILDWGLFHVEQNYHTLWNNYQRILKQRNSLLRQKASIEQFIPWNNALTELANQLDVSRQNYSTQLIKAFEEIIQEISDISCRLEYYKGWDKKGEGKSLEEILKSTHMSDLLRQYTHYGAHNADLMVLSNDVKAKHYLSRGQQKMVLFAIKLAQIKLLDKHCILLIDDFTSELDEKHINRLMDYLSQQHVQMFVTVRDNMQRLLNGSKREHSHFQMDECVAF